MSRPLVISDCDEVLLHMVSHYRDWLAEHHDVLFDLGGGDFTKAMKRSNTGEPILPERIWQLLGQFFDTEMYRQTVVPGAAEAIERLREHADVVVLTNLNHERRDARTKQLRDLGLDLRVFTNNGPKGPALKAILDEYQPSSVVFIDDLAVHHGSVAELTPHVGRLHLCAEPLMAPHIDCALQAGHAHARIDSWSEALPWLLGRLHAQHEEVR